MQLENVVPVDDDVDAWWGWFKGMAFLLTSWRVRLVYLVQVCWKCGRKATETCSGCSLAKYCSAYCQHKDWEHHIKVSDFSTPLSNGIPGLIKLTCHFLIAIHRSVDQYGWRRQDINCQQENVPQELSRRPLALHRHSSSSSNNRKQQGNSRIGRQQVLDL